VKYFIDTEFLESGPGRPITLLSLAMVAEDGREFYMATRERMQDAPNEFVRTQVLPEILRMREQGRVASLEELRQQVLDFIGDDKEPEFWANWAAYDWVTFCQVFGTMAQFPRRFPMFCMDLQQALAEAGSPSVPEKVKVVEGAIPHCALDDARCAKRVFDWLQTLHSGGSGETPKKKAPKKKAPKKKAAKK